MRAVVQTVGRAGVTVDGEVVGAIDDGLLVLLGVTHSDTVETAQPGGDFPARRTISTHLSALRAMGARDIAASGHHLDAPDGLRPCRSISTRRR